VDTTSVGAGTDVEEDCLRRL